MNTAGLPLPYTQPAAAGIYLAACLFWLIPETLGFYRQMAKAARRTDAVLDRGSLGILIGLQWVGIGLNFALAGFVPAAAIRWQRGALFLLGVVCILAGVAFRQYAIRTLGRFFTRKVAVTASQPVVQRGPYRLIRHPAYTGTLLTMLGVGLALTNWASLAALLACAISGHLYRVSVEEQALIRALGEPYIDYMRHTWRFIPGVY
ncbi:MAG TPA: isoprenylcysteine carboxylmethyltransferase family protein [Anaerolineaceae bacterium]|jgi:protein-S-isoprenylcysteine O-methyltransferase Ste14